MDKWEDHVEEWEKWDSSVSFEYWGRFELNEFLSQDKQRGRRYFWFKKDDLTFDKIRSFANRQISNAHTRYNPDLDVSLPIENLFSGLCRTAKFTEDIDDRKERLERLNQELKNADYIEDNHIDELSSGLERTVELIEQPESTDQNFPIERIEENITISIDKIERLLPQYREEKNDYDPGQGLSYTEKISSVTHGSPPQLREDLQCPPLKMDVICQKLLLASPDCPSRDSCAVAPRCRT